MAKNFDLVRRLRRYIPTANDKHGGKCLHRVSLSDSTVMCTDILGVGFRALEEKICIPCTVPYRDIRKKFHAEVFAALPTIFNLV